MFEQSVIEHPGNKSWSVAASISGQLLLLSIAALIPLVFTDQLSLVRWTKTYVAPVVPPAAVHLADVPATQRAGKVASPVTQKVFVWPAHIPNRIAMVTDAAPAIPDSGPGVPFSTGGVPAASGLIGELIRSLPAAPPKAQVAPPVQDPVKPVSVSSGVQSAKLLRRVIPNYPTLAKQARISGTVRLVGIIGKDGTIQNLQLVSGTPLLVQAALDAVRQWIYRPTLLNGQPVEVIAPIDVIFTLTR